MATNAGRSVGCCRVADGISRWAAAVYVQRAARPPGSRPERRSARRLAARRRHVGRLRRHWSTELHQKRHICSHPTYSDNSGGPFNVDAAINMSSDMKSTESKNRSRRARVVKTGTRGPLNSEERPTQAVTAADAELPTSSGRLGPLQVAGVHTSVGQPSSNRPASLECG